ncbi:MAG: hypothetical protein M3016_00725, partial [Actinomycetota bacterium]|nr:hypothetical protein [Actinomycetota bacterium]
QGNGNNAGAVTYGGPNGCSAQVTGNQYTSLTRDPVLEPWPEDYSQNTPACTVSAPSFTFSTNNATIPSGVYCATGNITLSGTNMSGNVTFIAGSFTISASGNRFTPYASNLILYQTGSSTMHLGSLNLGGTVFAPNATVIIDGNVNISAFVEADRIDVQGSNFTMTGTGPPSASSAGALTE